MTTVINVKQFFQVQCLKLFEIHPNCFSSDPLDILQPVLPQFQRPCGLSFLRIRYVLVPFNIYSLSEYQKPRVETLNWHFFLTDFHHAYGASTWNILVCNHILLSKQIKLIPDISSTSDLPSDISIQNEYAQGQTRLQTTARFKSCAHKAPQV